MSVRDEAQDQPARFDPSVREVMRSRALLRDPRFANLWISHGLALTAQNALLFTLLVVVFKITGNSLTTSILVLCFILPSIPMGFIVASVMFLLSAALASRLHTVQGEPEHKLPQGPIFGGLPTDFRESWQMLFSDRYSVLALVQLIISSTLVLLFSILIPRYMQDVIGVPPESAAFVFAPTGIGALVGLRFLPWFTKIGKNRVVIIGLGGIAACLVLLALVEPLAQLTEQAPGTDWLL